MSAHVVQREADMSFYTGLSSAPWSKYVNAAWVFENKTDAIAEIKEQGYRLSAFLFLRLAEMRPRPQYHQVYAEKKGED